MVIDKRTKLIAVGAVCLVVIIYLLDSRTEVRVLEDTSLPVGMKKPGPRKTYEEFVKAANMNPSYPINLPYSEYPVIQLPKYLKYKESLLTDVVNQDTCASCWAISVCHMIADRISLYTGGKIKRPLSYQELLSCFDNNDDTGCTVGGIPEQAYNYVAQEGLATEEDYPYVQASTTKIAKCDPSKKEGFRTYIRPGTVRSLCVDPDKYRKGSPEWQRIIDQNIRNMKTELFMNGPIVATIFVYKSLYNHDGLSIYDPSDDELGDYIGGHACEIIGIAEEVDGVEPGFDGGYHIIKNSWSSEWPLKSPASKGYVYIRAGRNCCGIESRASTCQIQITDEIKANMVESLDKSRYNSYTEYSGDPEKKLFVTKATKLRSMLK